MIRKLIYYLLLFSCFSAGHFVKGQQTANEPAFSQDSILASMYRVNDYFLDQQWKRVDRNWIRGTYYTGLMAFYGVTGDENLFLQARNWAAKHGWRTGTEWIYPANRMTCVQTYLQLYQLEPEDTKIENAREVMAKKIRDPQPASEQGWDYVDALYVGTPAYVMMTSTTEDSSFAAYAHRMFKDVYTDLFDTTFNLFYRDEKAKSEFTSENQPIFWSRGNGWAFASLPKILDNLPENDPHKDFYIQLLKKMAASLAANQGADGFWRVNLVDSKDFPEPESSGTAFFTYTLAWGINKGLLDPVIYQAVLESSWKALYSSVEPNGKVCWGQDVARGPEKVVKGDWHEYVSGAYLLAASEIYLLLSNKH